MARSAADTLRMDLHQKVEHKGVSIEFNAGYKTGSPFFRVANEYVCYTLDDAIKKANTIATKNRKLKEPITALAWNRRGYTTVDVVEIHDNGDVVLQHENGEREKLNSYKMKYDHPFANTPENKLLLYEMITLRKQIANREGRFTEIKALLTKADLTRK